MFMLLKTLTIKPISIFWRELRAELCQVKFRIWSRKDVRPAFYAAGLIPLDISQVLKPLRPGRQWQLVRGSAVARLTNRRSRSPDTFPSRCRLRSQFRQGFAESGFQAPFVARVADGTLPGPHTLHGRLCPTHPETVSAPCAKFDSIPIKIQQAKFPRTMVLKRRALHI